MDTIKGKHYLGKLDRNMGKTGTRNCAAYLTWELRADGEFAACGEVWNHIKSDIVMGGQCVGTLVALFPHDKRARRIRAIWERWHLNCMRAGCVHQRAAGWGEKEIPATEMPKTYHGNRGDNGGYLAGWIYPVNSGEPWSMIDNGNAHKDGLFGKPCPTCGYKYGSAWLKEELPAGVVAEVQSWSVAPAVV